MNYLKICLQSSRKIFITAITVRNLHPYFMLDSNLLKGCRAVCSKCDKTILSSLQSIFSTTLQRPITTLCWGHRDSRLFLACGPALYVVRVEHRVASLQLLCQQGIATAVKEEKDVAKLTMPSRLCSYVTTAFVPTIKVTQNRRALDPLKP